MPDCERQIGGVSAAIQELYQTSLVKRDLSLNVKLLIYQSVTF